MKKGDFYLKVGQGAFLLLMSLSYFIVKYPLLVFLFMIIGLIGAQQLIVYKRLWVIENNISTEEAGSMIQKQKVVVRIIQVCILITTVLVATQTFHKIKF